MEQIIVVNGVEFVKVSRNQVEQIEAGCRQYRSQYLFGSVKSVARLLIGSVQKLFGATRGYRVN